MSCGYPFNLIWYFITELLNPRFWHISIGWEGKSYHFPNLCYYSCTLTTSVA